MQGHTCRGAYVEVRVQLAESIFFFYHVEPRDPSLTASHFTYGPMSPVPFAKFSKFWQADHLTHRWDSWHSVELDE